MTELQDIFNAVTPSGLSPDQCKAFYSIRNCRTSILGSHVDGCTGCGHLAVSYNSCRNRHCPKCQGTKQKDWVNAQLAKLLPVPYFHVVFTLPNQLNQLIYQNQKLIYSLLLKCAGETVTELARDSKFLGAETGATAILHTWGQNLCFHPHVHCLVPGGGLSPDGLRFIRAGKRFFIPVKVLSRMFRGKFLFYLKEAWRKNELKFFGDACSLSYGTRFLDFVDGLYGFDWVVFCKKPFKSPQIVVKYLGRYTHRVAIANSRIVGFDEATVSFSWKDYKDKGKVKLLSLNVEEFVRRFLLHVLPSGFTRIRHYGILSSCNVNSKLTLCFRLSGNISLVFNVTEYVRPCPVCGSAMAFMAVFNNTAQGP